MSRLASQPLPIQVLGYEYDGGLSVRGVRIAAPLDIIYLLPRTANASNIFRYCPRPPNHADTLTNAWLTAQLDLYGVRYSHTSSREDYIRLLREEVSRPMCYPARVPIVRMFPFRYEWEERCREYEEAVKTGRHQEEFDALATLEEKANYDADMFVDTYFTSRETLPRPVALRGIRIDVVQKAASRVPGLVAWTGGTGSRRMLWLGWDKNSIELECAEQNLIDHYHAPTHRGLKRKHVNGAEAHAAEEKLAQGDAIERRGVVQMGSHILRHHEHRKNPRRRPGVPYLEGEYLVNIVDPEIAALYPNQGPLWIDVRASQTPRVYEATYDMQPMGRGVMLFSKDKDTLSAHAEACDAFADAGIRDDPGAFRAFHVGFQLGWTRKQRIMEADTPESIAAQRVRQYVTAKTPSGIKRYYMRWRGTGGQLGDFWRMQGLRERVDQREDGWVEFSKDVGGKLTINFGIGTVDGEFNAYKLEDQWPLTGIDWAHASKERWQWIPELSGSWAYE